MSLLSLSKKILTRSKDKQPAPKKAAGKPGKAAAAAPKKTAKSAKPVLEDAHVTGRLGAVMLMSEKALMQQGQGTLVLRVQVSASKYDVAQAIAKRYGVKVTSVRTAQMSSKRRARGASVGRTNFWKKAYVTVDDISKIAGQAA